MSTHILTADQQLKNLSKELPCPASETSHKRTNTKANKPAVDRNIAFTNDLNPQPLHSIFLCFQKNTEAKLEKTTHFSSTSIQNVLLHNTQRDSTTT